MNETLGIKHIALKVKNFADCLNFYTNTRAVKTASAVQVRNKMYQGSSDVWRQYSEHLKPLLDALK